MRSEVFTGISRLKFKEENVKNTEIGRGKQRIEFKCEADGGDDGEGR